ncbi:hypothetical protein [Planomonospora algeriensis]
MAAFAKLSGVSMMLVGVVILIGRAVAIIDSRKADVPAPTSR